MIDSIGRSDVDVDIRIPPAWAMSALVVLGMVIIMAANTDVRFGAIEGLATLAVGLGCLAVAALAWQLDNRNITAGRWLIIGCLVAVIGWAGVRWHTPNLLSLMVVPTALAASLISPTAAVVAAVFSSALVFALAPIVGATGSSVAATSLTGIWSILGIAWLSSRAARQTGEQAWQYYEHARTWLEAARDRKVELDQTMADLADANRQLTRLNILAQGLRQTAEEARAAKAQFVANVSHELRTPLNMIISFSELILQAPKTYGRRIPPALLADLVVIKRNAEHLADLVDDVLDLSQVESEQVALAKEWVTLHEIVTRAATAVRPLYDSKKLYLDVDIPQDLPQVFCDSTRIREVVLNLLSNAGRFTESGGVRMRAAHEGGVVTISIADTGPGISPDDMNKLFQPFQQLDGSIRRRFGGTGLGLSISKRFIDLHDGRIWAESTPGAGTTFFFQLPLAPAAATEGNVSRWLRPDWEYVQRTYPSKAPVAKVLPRFVVVDSGNALTRLLRRYLHEVEIVAMGSVDEALGDCAKTPAQMLLINGHTVGSSLEALYNGAELPTSLPVVVCSVPGVADASAALGVSDYLVKPIPVRSLLAALDRMNVQHGTVLIVDDEPDARHLFRRMLLSSGRDYQVLVAQDGREALDICRQYSPDVILLDLVLPNMDGFQLLKVRGEDPKLRAIPVILISARDPLGQPIISDAVAVTRRGGLSARQLLDMIKFLGGVAPAADQPADPALQADQAG